MKAPFLLDEGIYFEDTKQMLHWGEALESIKKIDTPEIDVNSSVMKWNNKICFGGKNVDIIVVTDHYENQNGLLETVTFSDNQNDPWKTYREFSSLFKKYLGQSNEFREDGNGRPTELWTLDDLQIIVGVGERFVEFEILGICKGERRWKLDNTK